MKEASIHLIKKIIFRIDAQLLKAHNGKKKTSPSLKFKNQWNYILDVVKDLGNHKIRYALLTSMIKPDELVYANSEDLKEYLPEEKQKNLEAKAEKIVRIS
jgi:hypothetical protein